MMIREEQTEHIRQQLVATRKELQDQLHGLAQEDKAQEADNETHINISDDANDVAWHDRNLALRNNAQDLLKKVNEALGRLDTGTYGICARCGKPIATERLEALPYATMCVSCQSALES